MSVKKIPSLCKLYSFYEEIPEEFLDETDIKRYFYNSICDFSKSQHRTVRVSGCSNKKSFAIKLFHFCDLETEQRYKLQEVNNSKSEHSFSDESFCNFLRTFDKASKCIQIPLSQPKLEIRFTKSKDHLFAHYYNHTIEHPYR